MTPVLHKAVIVFGGMVLDLDLAAKWNEFVTKKMMSSEYWPSEFDTCDSRCKDWGHVSASNRARVNQSSFAYLVRFMTTNGFMHEVAQWGEVRFEVGDIDKIPSEVVNPDTV